MLTIEEKRNLDLLEAALAAHQHLATDEGGDASVLVIFGAALMTSPQRLHFTVMVCSERMGAALCEANNLPRRCKRLMNESRFLVLSQRADAGRIERQLRSVG